MRRSAASSSSTMMGARPSSRLVEQHQARVQDQRAAERQHLLLAAGELVAEVAPPLLQPREHARRPARTVQGPGRATAVMFSSTVSERKMLRSCGTQPMPAAARSVRPQPGDVAPGKPDAPALAGRQADDGVDQRRLARAVAAQQRQRAAVAERKADAAEHRRLAIAGGRGCRAPEAQPSPPSPR